MDGNASQRPGSVMSGLSSLSDDTDEFGRMLIQQARDEQHKQGALRGSVQPFRKARTHPRVGLTLENLERNNRQQPSPARQQRDSPESFNGSDRSDPPVRPPRQWGSKARHDNSWLRRINAADPMQEQSGEESDASYQQRVAVGERTPRAADVPLPSVEDSPAILRKLVEGTPSSTKRYDASLQEWDLSDDLTSGSFLASTPAMPRNTRLDDIRQRERESMNQNVVETNGQGRSRGTSPEGSPTRPSSAYKYNQTKADGSGLRERPESEVNLPTRLDRLRSKRVMNAPVAADTGETIPGSPVVVYRSPPGKGEGDRGQTSPPKRFGSRSNDSHDLLRRLARATSNSPSPSRSPEDKPVIRRDSGVRKSSPLAEEQGNEPSQKKGRRNSRLAPGETATTSAQGILTPPPDADNGAVELDPSKASKTRDVNANNSAPKSSGAAADTRASQTHRDELPPPTKTPVVAGAWPDTPATEAPRSTSGSRRGSEISARSSSTSRSRPAPRTSASESGSSKQEAKKSTISQNESKGKGKAPSLPKSALSAVVKNARSQRKGGQADDAYGDSTIDSLADMVSSPTENTTELEIDEDTLEVLEAPGGRPKTLTDREKQQESLQLQNMNVLLRGVRSSVKDANRNMRRLEQQVDTTERRPSVAEEPRGLHQNCPCATGQPSMSPPRWFWEWIKGLYYDKKGKGNFTKLTWFGVISLLLWSWFWTETALCNVYCNKVYAHRMEGYGVDPNAPEPPYVTLTVLSWIPPFNWLKPFVLTFLSFLSWTLKGVYHAVFTAFRDSEGARRTVVRTATEYTRRAVQPTMDPEWVYRMSDDAAV
ncbi:uncharacterized protein K452DRAFT_356380 [Aplosporella prunicola CBS 121167]|uniref:Uncharacterized protein n=1 Tax=Aplosporella prunicola CBS 121167 TaxID=1176127 RepID=A0A6A6BP94_9PEZI|nr:uncharacterized protein K452DRAFT_356380 [Aplosporella prunicola CBS 121167]KAF2145044.1 hypothetical protein K452DRAFT_356380 [Aplosporella prunicola CBS 121167]